MCFSAEASFGASAVIMTIGLVSLKKSRDLPQKFLSCIPVIFAVQQFAEGVLWISKTHPGHTQLANMATYAFLIFAQVVWPLVLPFSILLLEKEDKKKKILSAFVVMGIILASVFAYTLAFFPVQSSVSCYHIRYDIGYPPLLQHKGIFYLIVTIFPQLISSHKRIKLLGITMFTAYVITRIFYEYYLTSVWCFFAAIISIVVLSVIIELEKSQKIVPSGMPY